MDNLELRLNLRDWQTCSNNIKFVGNPHQPILFSSERTNFTSVGGNWAAIFTDNDKVTLVQDHLRSFPLFYSVKNGRVLVSDDIAYMRKALEENTPAKQFATEFLYLGFVTGPDTLFESIKQVQAGEIVTISDKCEVSSNFYHRMKYTGANIACDSEADLRFGEAFDIALDVLLKKYPNNQLVIPLSGGLDSRLLATEIAARKIPNILTFTYGVAESAESKISQDVAKSLGLEWEFVSYTPEEYKKAWAMPEAAEFIRDSYVGASLPHVQDWYAIFKLKQEGRLDVGAVFLPGHCVVGAMHNEEIVATTDRVSSETIAKLIYNHHANIRSGSKALLKETSFYQKVINYLDRVGFDGSQVMRVEALEDYNFLERQTKYINNSMRTYEHFGYNWALPMLDIGMFEAWEDFSIHYTKNRDWYRRYVNKRYSAVTGNRIGEFTPNSVSKSVRDTVKKILYSLGLLTIVDRFITLKAVENHPMAFQTLIGEAKPKDLRFEIMRGGSQMGLYTEQFLADTWNPLAHIFTHRENS